MKLFLLSTSAILFTNGVYAAQDYTATKVNLVESIGSEDPLLLDELSDKTVFIEEENNDRASCRDRGSRDWCTNDYQPSSGDCEWHNGKCRTASSSDDRASCRSRGNRDWCTNDYQPSSGDCEWRNGECHTASSSSGDSRSCRSDKDCVNRNDYCNKNRNRCERATGQSCKSGTDCGNGQGSEWMCRNNRCEPRSLFEMAMDEVTE